MHVARGHLDQGATQTGTITPPQRQKERHERREEREGGWEEERRWGEAKERPCRLRGRQEASSAVLGGGVGGGLARVGGWGGEAQTQQRGRIEKGGLGREGGQREMVADLFYF